MTILDRDTAAQRLTALALHPPPHAFPMLVWEDAAVAASVRQTLMHGKHGVRVQTGVAGISAIDNQGGVVILDVNEVREAQARGIAWREGQVWCVVGGPVDEDSRAWMERSAGGPALIFHPDAVHEMQGRPGGWAELADLLESAGSRPGVEYNPVVVLAQAEQVAAVEGESLLRLEAAGAPRVRTISAAGHVTRAALGGLSSGQVVVIRAESGWTSQSALEEAVETISELIRQGVQVILVTEPRLGHDIEDDPDWSAVRLRATFVRVDREDHATTRDVTQVEWPRPYILLPGMPDHQASTTVVARGRISGPESDGGFTVTTLVQQAANSNLTGELVLFRNNQLGTMRFYQGLLVGVKILDGAWPMSLMIAGQPEGTERELRTRLMLDRAARLSLWPVGTEWVMRSELGDPISADAPRIPYGSVAMNVARWVDEVSEAQRTLGGWSRRWTGLPNVPDDLVVEEPMGRLWTAADGHSTLLDMAVNSQLLLPDALTALGEAVRLGIILPGDDDPNAQLDTTEFHKVLHELFRRGLMEEARGLLEAGEDEHGLGPWAARHLGYLLAESDPAHAVRLWGSLGERPRTHEHDALSTQDDVETMLARRVLEARQPQSNALALWRAARRELEVQEGGYQWTARLAGAVAELGLRAQDWASAEAAIAALRRYPEAERRPLLGALLTAGRALGARFGND